MNSFHSISHQPVALDPELNVLSVDLECWEQLIFRKITGTLIPCSDSVLASTGFLLDLFRSKGVKATFFVVGYVAETFPELIERIHLEGHEVASHGYTHATLDTLSPDEFREEIRRCVSLLGSLTGAQVLGFRAPEFSLRRDTLWALEILAQEGIEYDSSMVPSFRATHGGSEIPRSPSRFAAGPHTILEVPPSTIAIFGRNQLAAGGSYFRLLPYFLIKRIVNRVTRGGLPFVLYCHPYEFSAERLTLPADAVHKSRSAAIKMELKYNLLRETMRWKLSKLLDELRFAPFREVLALDVRK